MHTFKGKIHAAEALAIFSLFLLAAIFFFSPYVGDADQFLRHIYLTKAHLRQEFAIPYFTPGICGGMVLAADAQDQLFTLLTPLSIVLRDPFLAFRLSIFLYSILLGLGVSLWAGFIPGLSKLSRTFAGMLVSLSGFWVMHIKVGHLSFHGVAFLPWLFWGWEKLLADDISFRRARKYFVFFSLFFFLLLNSGPIWAQIFLLMAISRFVAEFVLGWKFLSWRREGLAIALLAGAAIFAFLVSAPRYLAIFQFTLRNFPRDLPVAGVFGGSRHALVATLRALFDPSIIIRSLPEPHLGAMHEWTAYIGLFALVAAAASLGRIFAVRKNKILLGLATAALLQFLTTVRPTPWQWVRAVFPVFNGLSYYYRGVIIIVFFVSILAAVGLERLLSHRAKFFRITGILLPFLCGAELGLVYFSWSTQVPASIALQGYSAGLPERFTAYQRQETVGMKDGLASGGCYDPAIVGYGNEFFRSQVNFQEEIFHQAQPGAFNINDVGSLFDPKNPPAYYKTHEWPLWPADKRADLERFVLLGRGYEIPAALRTAELGSGIAALAWLLLAIVVAAECWKRKRAA